jgi:hypothetical protein
MTQPIDWNAGIASIAKVNRFGAFLSKLLASDNPNELLTYVNTFTAATHWFGSVYMGAETVLDAQIDLAAHLGSNKSYQRGMNLLAYFGRVLYRKELYTPKVVYRVHDIRERPEGLEVGDTIAVTPHKSCLSYTDLRTIKIPARDAGHCDILFSIKPNPKDVVWTYKTGAAMREDFKEVLKVIGVSSPMELHDFHEVEDRLEMQRQHLLWATHSLMVAPFEQEYEVIVYHEDMKPLHAYVERIY